MNRYASNGTRVLPSPGRLKSICACLLASFSFAATAAASAPLIEESILVSRADGSAIEILISRPNGAARVPILLMIDGSMCFRSQPGLLHPSAAPVGGYALVIVEKPQPTPLPSPDENGEINIGPDFKCSDTFKRYYSIDRRVLDHLRAIQHLRTHAAWWDGSLLVWGFSDGGRVGSRVGSYAPETRAMVLGGFGGGATMASEFEDHHICAASRTDDRPACLDNLREKFSEIRSNPVASETWNGDSNTYTAWASRLDAVEANILQDARIPILVFHGTLDNSVPISSARKLATIVSEHNPRFVYREMEGMGHGLGSNLEDGARARLAGDLLGWLLSQIAK